MAFTPRARPPSRVSRLTLSTKEYTKINHTLASVRRSRLPEEPEPIDEEEDAYLDEPSFVSERSFVRAPLNSRLGPVPSTPGGKGKERSPTEEEDFSMMDLDVQEAQLLEDLLNVLKGIEGIAISFDDDYLPDEGDEEMLLRGPKLVVNPTINPSLRDLAERVLPLATSYMSVKAFIEFRSSLECGLVNHALCAALRDLLKEYQTLIAHLEEQFNTSPEFSLQTLLFHVHPSLHTLGLMYKLVQALSPVTLPEDSEDEDDASASGESSEDEAAKRRREALGLAPLPASLKNASPNNTKPATSSYAEFPIVGGEVLAVISSIMKLQSGDPDASRVYGLLWQKSSQPYMKMLKRWMTRGIWRDRWEEGCVREAKWTSNVTSSGDEEWERRYTLRDGSTQTTSSKSDRMSSALPNQGPVGVPPLRPFLTPPQPNSTEKRLPGGACIPPELEPWKHKVLLAGKYLNVIRACGVKVNGDEKGEAEVEEVGEHVDLASDSWRKQIEEAYTYANVTLLALLIGNPSRSLSGMPTILLQKALAEPVKPPVPLHLAPLSQNPPSRGSPGTPNPMHQQRSENTLISRLRSLRHFFFLAQGSYLPHFLDLASVEMRKSTKSVSHTRLQPLLDIALAAENSPHREDVKVIIGATGGLYDWLLKIVSVQGVAPGEQPDEDDREKKDKDKDGRKEKDKGILAIDALCLDYEAPFPLSLVISRSTLMRYQIIFRFLLHLKHIERVLSSMWLDQKAPVWREPLPMHPELDKWRNRVFLLRAKMLAFIQQVLSFSALDVLEPNWKKFEERIAGVKTVDELMRDHVDFLDTCLKGCMLTNSKLLKSYSKLIVTCSTFALYSNQFTTSATQAVGQLDEADGDPSAVPMEKRWEFLKKFQVHFDHWFTSFADIIQFFASSENVALLPLVTRLAQAQLLNRGEVGPLN